MLLVLSVRSGVKKTKKTLLLVYSCIYVFVTRLYRCVWQALLVDYNSCEAGLVLELGDSSIRRSSYLKAFLRKCREIIET